MTTSPILVRGPTVVEVDRDMVNVGALLTPTIQKLYSIFLWDLPFNSVVPDATLDPSGSRPTAEFFFNTPPRQVEMSEPFTTRVVATQNGGKFIESHGSIFKDIRVTGTTGLRPRKGAPTVIPLLSTGAFDGLVSALTEPFSPGGANQLRKIPVTEVTGFDDIHFLRNIFRRYSDAKSRGEQVVMVWRNIKDNDYWVVEPKDFRLSQDSKNPLTYQYQIQLQGLSLFSVVRPDIPDDPLALVRDAQRFISRISEFKQNLTSTFLVIATQITRIQGAGYFGISNTLGTLTSVIRGLEAIFTNAGQSTANLTRAAVQAQAEFDEAITSLGAVFEPPISAPPGGVATVDDRDATIQALRAALRSLRALLAEESLQTNISQVEGTVRNRIGARYRRPGNGAGAPTSPRTGGDPAFIGSSSTAATIAEGTVGVGETIRDLSRRLLGDYRRWHELVLLNDLRSPYTTDGVTTPGVLSSGDSILFPSISTTIRSTTVGSPNQSTEEQEGDLDNPGSVLSQTYGRDIRLKSVKSAGSIDFTDLAINQRGDISTVVGVPNVQQAIRVRFLTEQGDLPVHPTYGASFPIGSKADVFSFNTFRVNTLATMKSDPRIKEVVSLDFTAVGDILYVNGVLLLQDAQDYVATNFALRRF